MLQQQNFPSLEWKGLLKNQGEASTWINLMFLEIIRNQLKSLSHIFKSQRIEAKEKRKSLELTWKLIWNHLKSFGNLRSHVESLEIAIIDVKLQQETFKSALKNFSKLHGNAENDLKQLQIRLKSDEIIFDNSSYL